MRYTLARFIKGISKSFDILFSQNPERLYTLQNARLLKRGEFGFVSRIKGFVQWFSPKQYDNLDLLSVKGQLDTTEYQKGYRIFFINTIKLVESFPLTIDLSNIIHSIDIEEFFLSNLATNPSDNFTETILFKENFVKRRIPYLKFNDTISVFDTLNLPIRTTLTFNETVSVFDERFEENEIQRLFRAIIE